MSTVTVYVPRLEDEIEQAWAAFRDSHPVDYGQLGTVREAFEAGFRLARTVMINREF